MVAYPLYPKRALKSMNTLFTRTFQTEDEDPTMFHIENTPRDQVAKENTLKPPLEQVNEMSGNLEEEDVESSIEGDRSVQSGVQIHEESYSELDAIQALSPKEGGGTIDLGNGELHFSE